MAEQLTSYTELPVADIRMGPRLRPVSNAGVESIIASITELGVMKDPVHVRKVKHRDGALILMAGGHRLEAATRLGWEMIPATVWHCTDDWAALMEIDDNLASSELNALDTAVFLAARKRVYERLHPETRAGAAGGHAKHNSATDIVSFAETTAEKFGMTARNVRRIIAAGTALNPDELTSLRSADLPVTLADLTALAKTGDAQQRRTAIAQFAGGQQKSVKAGLKALSRGDISAPKDPLDAQYVALKRAWGSASKSVRLRWLATQMDAVTDLIDRIDGGDA